jgi:hypothetical protein
MATRPSPEECEAILQQKLADLHEDLGDEKTNFKASFALNLPHSPVVEDVNNDFLREQAFQAVTLEGVKKARELLIECEIPYIRPPTMFAEMMKSEAQMERIRDSLSDQKEKKEKMIARQQQKKDQKKKDKPKPKQRPGVSMKPRKEQPKKKHNQQNIVH